MKPENWKDVAELIGVAAIVASLVFVGLQLRQEQEIAITETFGDMSQSMVDLALEIGNHMDTWQRGLDGEELTSSEQGRFDALATSAIQLNQRIYIRWVRLGPIDPDVAASSFAYALYIFPGLRRHYEAVNGFEASLESARGFSQAINPWQPAVNRFLQHYDETQPPIPEHKNYLFWSL